MTQDLTTKEDAAELTAKWKKLAIVLPFVLGLIGIFVGQFGKEKAVEKTAAVGPAPVVASASAPGESRYESWTVDGWVKVDKSKFAAFNIYIKASPPRLSLDAGGKLLDQVPVEVNNGVRTYPTLEVIGPEGYGRATVRFKDEKVKPPDWEDYGQEIDEKSKTLRLNKIIELKEIPYAGGAGQKAVRKNPA